MVRSGFHSWPMRLTMISIVSLSVAACGHTPVTSLYKLNKIDAQTTRLDKLRVAVQIPAAFRPSAIKMLLKLEKTATKPGVEESFILSPSPLPLAAPELRKYRTSKRRIYSFQITATDIPRFDRFRKLKAGAKGKRSGSMSVSADVCRTGNADMSSIVMSTFLKTSETGEFVPLALNVDLLSGLKVPDPDQIAPLCG